MLGGAAPRVSSADSAAFREAISAYGEVAAALDEIEDLDSFLRLVAKKICELVQVRRCSIYLRDEEDPTIFRGRVGHADQDIDRHVRRLVAGSEADRFTREIVETKQPVALTNALTDPRPIRSTMRAWNVRSMLGVPMLLRGEVEGIIYLDNDGEPHSFGPEAHEIASVFADLAAVGVMQARAAADLKASVRSIVQQNRLMRRAVALDERLMRLVLDGASLTAMAEAIAEATGKPCAIHDASLRCLVAASPSHLQERIVPRLLDDDHRDHSDVRAALAATVGRPLAVIGPLPDAGLPQRFIVVPVSAAEEHLGYLVLMEYGSRFTRLDSHIATHAAITVGLGLAAERRVAAAEWDARQALAADLVRGNRDTTSLQRRAEHLGIDLSAPRVLCLVASESQEPGPPPSAGQIAETLGALLGDGEVLAAGVAEGVVAIVRLPENVPALEGIAAVRTALADTVRSLGRGDMIGAVSTRCTAPSQFERAYAEARQVMSCVRTFLDLDGPMVLSADDLGPGRLFLAASDRAEADRFAEDTLGPLLADNDGMRDLLNTLRVFFDCSRSVRRAALALGIHENTIRYRLSRIDELTGLNVNGDSDDQLAVQLALLILRLEGRLPSAPTGQLEETGEPLEPAAA